VFAALVMGIVLASEPAQAICPGLFFDDAIAHSNVVWWGTVTSGTAVVVNNHSNYVWLLTVRLNRVLKGPGSTGEIEKVLLGDCSVPRPRRDMVRFAQAMVGQTLLFVGRLTTSGRLDALPDSFVLRPGTDWSRTPQDEFARALSDLSGSRATWAAFAIGGFALTVVVGAVFLARRHRSSAEASAT
jgi:hypothetical protein